MDKKDQVNYIFQRVEKKYLLSQKMYRTFLHRISPYVTEDQYGKYIICNIYFDTDTYDLVRISNEKPVYKEKLRLRSYGIPGENDTVFLEIKKKYRGVVSKRRVALTMREARKYLKNGLRPGKGDPLAWQILNEIEYFINYYRVSPKIYLAYDRQAFCGNSLRITFDSNIRSRDYDLDLSMGDYGVPLLDDDSCLMEIKALAAFPVWLARILSEMEIFPISFSKYGNVYKNLILNKWEGERKVCLQVS